jgi:Hom_end-associated Hint/Type III restriction enzyme, res subunit/Homing endonuclease
MNKKQFFFRKRTAGPVGTKAPIKKTSPKNREPDVYEPPETYKESIRSVAYLGKKGYTIPKASLEKEDEEFLRKDLFVKPEIHGANFGGAPEVTPFPVFRENSNKIYLPRFYGMKRYGEPHRSEMQEGDDINVRFDKPLRDYQETIVGAYMDYVGCKDGPVREVREASTTNWGGGGILDIYTGAGKCLGKDTEILMFDGTIKLVQDIVVGDQIMGDDSTPRNVLTLARGRETMYKVQPKKGDGYIVNESHILSLRYGTDMKNAPKGTIIDISVKDYLNLPKTYHGRAGPLYGYRVPIDFPEKEVEFDPYLLGYWLGDGNSRGTGISTQESTVIKYMVDCFKTKHTTLYLKYTGAQYDYRINSICEKNQMLDFLRANNLILNKHIPHHYKCNSRSVRMAVLAGLIDSDGYCGNNCYEITQKNERLLDDIVFLARSLGFAAFKKKVLKSCVNAKDGPKQGTYFKTNIYGAGLELLPILCPRKKGEIRQQIKNSLNYRIELQKLEEDDYYGFEIDGNHRFVLGDFTVTHNTVMALKIVSLLQKKTLIIVHKEFLMNQWIERIEEYLPSARVGKIQGPVFDVDGKDIVIGMVQTLYDREYPVEAFSCFGLTIIDEVHRIGSEQFSKTLFKTITPYMLGISATVERKDKLTKILYMFIGDIIYSAKRDASDVVDVRGIHYKSNDTEFNEVETDFRGMPKYSSMIVKLCDYGPRSDFIIRILRDLITEGPESQIMVLCHNRSLLVYLYDGVVHHNFATIGYYVGGMKQNKLHETEGKQSGLATYAMAAEALDIKTLSTLVMVTPKTDITQSVGRILRMKHANPIIVDIIDSHDVFKNQWTQRKRFYKKSNYRIWEIESAKYQNMDIDPALWKKTNEPKACAATSNVRGVEEDDDDDPAPTNVFKSLIPQGTCMIDTSMFT